MPDLDTTRLHGLVPLCLVTPDPYRGSGTAEQPELLLDCRDGRIWADACSPGHGISSAEWHGHVRSIRLPLWADASDLHRWAEDNRCRLQAVIDGYESAWDGSNHRGRLTESADSVMESLRQDWDDDQEPSGPWGLWSAGDWLGDLSDAELAQLGTAAEIDADAEGRGVVLTGTADYMAYRARVES